MAMTLEDTLDILRGRTRRLIRYRKPITRIAVAAEMGINVLTLSRLLDGSGNLKMDTLIKIETWCEKQDSRHA